MSPHSTPPLRVNLNDTENVNIGPSVVKTMGFHTNILFANFLHSTSHPPTRVWLNNIGNVMIHLSKPKNYRLDTNNDFILLKCVPLPTSVPRGILPTQIFFSRF
jgi:hypothetical protein